MQAAEVIHECCNKTKQGDHISGHHPLVKIKLSDGITVK